MRLKKAGVLLLLVGASLPGGPVSALKHQGAQNGSGAFLKDVLGPGEDGGLQGDSHGRRIVGGGALGASLAEVNPGATRLQTVLNRICGTFFNDLCGLGVQQFCNGDAVGRYGVGKAASKEAAWRCYAAKTLSKFGESNVQCADDCGLTIPCEGVVVRSSLFLTLEQSLQKMPSKIAERTCPKAQKELNKFCSSFGNDHLARYSPTPKYNYPSWRCFKKSQLLFDTTSECAGHCTGKLVKCPGGIPPNASNEDVEYYTRKVELTGILYSMPESCPGSKCVEASTEGVCKL